jgi:hypothetical protein
MTHVLGDSSSSTMRIETGTNLAVVLALPPSVRVLLSESDNRTDWERQFVGLLRGVRVDRRQLRLLQKRSKEEKRNFLREANCLITEAAGFFAGTGGGAFLA